jgi:class 3 adenylate cyclase
VGSWPVRLASISMRGLGLVATQTLMFSFAGIDGSAAMAQRLGDAYAGVLADYHRLFRAGLAAHGG